MNELADLIVDKLLTTYIREQSTWYTNSTMDDNSFCDDYTLSDTCLTGEPNLTGCCVGGAFDVSHFNISSNLPL